MEDIEKTVIPFETTRIPDSAKPVGEEVVVEDGVDGVRIVTRVGGQIVSDKTTHPKKRVIYFGTNEITSDVPQEESPEQTPLNTEVDTLPPLVPTTPNSDQYQGRDTEYVGKNKLGVTMNVDTLKKAGLEFARLLVFAIPGILITVLTANPELGGSLGATILLVLKSIDRGVHESDATPKTGLLPF